MGNYFYRPARDADSGAITVDLDDPGKYSTYYITYSYATGRHSLKRRTFASVDVEWETVVPDLTGDEHQYLLDKGVEAWA